MTSCSHELHENIIECQPYVSMKHEQNITFIIVDEILLIVDTKNFISFCPHCNKKFNLYIYGEGEYFRASFDGVTDLPICEMVSEIKEFISDVNVCSEPRFGKNFIYGVSYLHRLTKGFVNYFIIYCTKDDLKGYYRSSFRHLYVNDKPAVCCCNINGEFILINSDGHIIETEIVHSKTGQMFKVYNGYLDYDYDNNHKIVWTFTSLPALNTKPAAASSVYADE